MIPSTKSIWETHDLDLSNGILVRIQLRCPTSTPCEKIIFFSTIFYVLQEIPTPKKERPHWIRKAIWNLYVFCWGKRRTDILPWTIYGTVAFPLLPFCTLWPWPERTWKSSPTLFHWFFTRMDCNLQARTGNVRCAVDITDCSFYDTPSEVSHNRLFGSGSPCQESLPR